MAIQSQIRDELPALVSTAHRELIEQLGAKFDELQPILERLRDLRIAHDGAYGTTGLPQFDELLASIPASKMGAWIAAARSLGVDVAA